VQIFTDNYFKFKKAAGVDNDDPEDAVGITELGRMCLLISRVPLLRDTHTAMEEWSKREEEMNNAGEEDEDGEDEEEDEDEEDEDEEEDEEDADVKSDGEDKDKQQEAHRRGMLLNQRSLASRRLIDDEDNVEMY
jgi:hypothetical protein